MPCTSIWYSLRVVHKRQNRLETRFRFPTTWHSNWAPCHIAQQAVTVTWYVLSCTDFDRDCTVRDRIQVPMCHWTHRGKAEWSCVRFMELSENLAGRRNLGSKQVAIYIHLLCMKMRLWISICVERKQTVFLLYHCILSLAFMGMCVFMEVWVYLVYL